MVIYYVRHGDPTYIPDALTPLGLRQAEAAAKRLALHGVDKIYSSPLVRTGQTAKPLSEIAKKDVEIVEFASETKAWFEFTVERNGERRWVFQDPELRTLFTTEEVTSLGHRWYEHPRFLEYKDGCQRVHKEINEFLKSLGYEQIDKTGRYKVLEDNQQKIAFFAHQGFGVIFLSVVLGIPFPMISNHFDMCHTGITAIHFKEQDGYSIPIVLELSSDAHLYKEGLPTLYNNEIYL